MFINKIKEQLMAEKSCGQTASPQNQQTEQQQQQQQQLQQVQSYSHALITSGTISGVTQTPSIDVKECGQTQPMVTENVTVLPLPSTALMTGLVITSPSASLSSSSSGLSPLIHPPTFSLAGTPTMIVSGLPPGLSGQTVPSLSGLEKKVPEEAQGPGHPPHPAQDEGPNKPPGTRKRKVRPSEPTLAELADPYAVPNDDDGGKDGKSYRRQHNKDKPFKCQHCHRAYTDSPSLQVHLATHTVKHIKAYACNSCRKSYTSETYLMKHMRKHKAPEQGPDPFGATSAAQAPPADAAQCSFDLLAFKPDSHKDPCLTVSANALQVDQMGGS
ncbi:hypothetical protein scyTo_0021114 [Scyliorhinus torazame]|uniref:C2H2-type domain-containing protein n=1 Tax=Scyliorhinus torazame TaxID=75743 RepID=A0A401PWT2_SCYTO|nr:hypothetical protein [Scyliorhinus torazame]